MDESPDAAHASREARWDPGLLPAVEALADDLLPVFYADLKRLAHRERARVRGGETLQTTALVHEAYLKLRNGKGWSDEAHFLRAAALAMRHALVNHAVARRAVKRGGASPHLPLNESLVGSPADDETILALDEALSRLARRSLRLARVVECRFFAGLDDRETARALELSERTVRRDWSVARAWLYRELSRSGRVPVPGGHPSTAGPSGAKVEQGATRGWRP